MTYNVFSGMLNPTQILNQSITLPITQFPCAVLELKDVLDKPPNFIRKHL